MVYVSEVNTVHDLKGLMFPISLMWGFSGSLRGIYLIAQKLNIPLILQPHVLILIYAISWTQVMGRTIKELLVSLRLLAVFVL